MQLTNILRILGILLSLFSLSMLPPAAVNYFYQDGEYWPFLTSFLVTLGIGLFLWLLFYRARNELKTRDGFLIVILFWFVLCFFAAIPFMLSQTPHLKFADAMFESVSGFTTTGASILYEINELPHAIKYYRQQLQFLGGMGIVVLAVAILPILGIGGMQLYRAEMPGPLKDSKLTPRITETAKALWMIYVGLTIICAFTYWLAGMSLFDAIAISFSTVSTGGFTPYDQSIGHFQNYAIENIAIIFMILGGINFSLHFIAFRQRSLKHYWQDEEFYTYLFILLFVTIIVATVLILEHTYASPLTAFAKSAFNVVSLATTTGFLSGPFVNWPLFIPVFVMITAIIGGCAASTSGGIKIIRSLLIIKQSHREVRRLLHPNAVVTIKFGEQILPDRILHAMWAFISTFIALFILLTLVLIAEGLNLHQAVSAVTASLANAGAAIGQLTVDFGSLSDSSKWTLMLAMIAGRLEIFSLLVLFTSAFWRD